jgi:iron uptake system EfeUOB component EfeO/EfeM
MDSTGFDDQLMFEGPGDGADGKGDGDEVVYMCKAPTKASTFSGTERLVPITCAAWARVEPISDEKFAEMDRMIAAREARMKDKGER